MGIARNRIAATAVAPLVLLTGACADTGTASPEAGETITVEDNFGTQTVPASPQRVVATDNRTFQTLDAMGVELVAAPRTIMSPSVSYRDDEAVVDLGNHREPDLEALVGVDPDLVVNGQRFASHRADMMGLVPDAAFVELDVREDQPLDAELRRQTTVLGEVFGTQEAAAELNADLDAAIERVQAAYDPTQTVMAVLTTGGEITYVAPGDGRTLGPLFDVLGLTPALDLESDSNSHGDDISVEAIAQADPDWILVLDRDAGTAANNEEPFTPAGDLIAGSAALQNVTAVTEGQLVHAPQETYLNEGVITYTEILNDFADGLEGAQS